MANARDDGYAREEDPSIEVTEQRQMTQEERAEAYAQIVRLIRTEAEFAGAEWKLSLDGAEFLVIDRSGEAQTVKLPPKAGAPVTGTIDKYIGMFAKDLSASGNLRIRVKETKINQATGKAESVTELEIDAGANWTAVGQGALDDAAGKNHL